MRSRPALGAACALLLLCLPPRVLAGADDEPKLAGSDVEAPKRTRFVMPAYPPEAVAKGARGIVMLDVVIGRDGKVETAEVVRSVPLLDEAALAAIRKWEYEVTRVAGEPVRVRLAVPITFSLRLPELTRQPGIPELRQGATPAWPPAPYDRSSGSATAEVVLAPDGGVAEARLRSGEPPWSEALLQAVRGWRFEADAGGGEVSFRVRADFVAGKTGPGHVAIDLSGLQRSESLAQPPSLPATAATPSPEPPLAGWTGGKPPAPEARPAPPRAEAAPPAGVPTPGASPSPATPPVRQSPAGLSLVSGVSLGPGVPELTRGRRPGVPPLARMAGARGSVEVRFSVDAAGITLVRSLDGADVFKAGAEQCVASWVFQRTSAERLSLLAVFDYEGDRAKAAVRVEP